MEGEPEAEQDARVDSLWRSLDVQDSGQLDLDGLRQGLRKIDHPLKNADDLIKEILLALDLDGDGTIQYKEFRTFVKHAERELWQLFKSIDQDQNNRLTKPELQEAFSKAGIAVSNARLDAFFAQLDANNDGWISFEEWRDFLLFVPADSPTLRKILSYYSNSVKVNQEGDVHVSDDAIQGLGTPLAFPLSLFIPTSSVKPQRIRHRPPDVCQTIATADAQQLEAAGGEAILNGNVETTSSSPGLRVTESRSSEESRLSLTSLLPSLGYFIAGGIAGIVSRTSTAPLDRLKVYLIAQTGPSSNAVVAAKNGSALKATQHATKGLIDACKALWRAGGIRSLFAGNGINVAKVMPESAIKFGSYEASKRFFAKLEGHGDPSRIRPWSQFAAGGMGGIISQFAVYPVDTLKFRMQCETVEGGSHGNRLIIETWRKMWHQGGLRALYRGLPMGLVGMFPYSAIDLSTFEYLKKTITERNAKARGCHEDDATPGSVATAAIGGFSGAIGASAVYPINLLRTRLQAQGTATHPRTYTGIMDVTRQTIQGEGIRGLFKGLTPNLLKVVPAVSITYVVYENCKKILHIS